MNYIRIVVFHSHLLENGFHYSSISRSWQRSRVCHHQSYVIDRSALTAHYLETFVFVHTGLGQGLGMEWKHCHLVHVSSRSAEGENVHVAEFFF